jgi:predicted enzyme related to lactoylglutathione lyase
MATNNSNSGFAIHSIFGVLTTFAQEAVTLSNGVLIPKGYLRATDLTQAASKETGKQKQWVKYFKSASAQEYLLALAEDLGCLIENKSNMPYGTMAQAQEFQPLVIIRTIPNN